MRAVSVDGNTVSWESTYVTLQRLPVLGFLAVSHEVFFDAEIMQARAGGMQSRKGGRISEPCKGQKVVMEQRL